MQLTSLFRRPIDPVLLRELRSTVRPPGFGRVLTLGPAAVAAVVVLGALACADEGRSAATVGRLLFHTYFVAAYALVALVSAVLGASGVARDAESGMLEALALTHLSPARTLGSKVAAQWSVVLSLLAATAPAAAVPLLWGGVAPVEVAAGLFVLAIVALLGLSTGVAVAARRTPVRWSIVVAVAVVAPLSFAALVLLQLPSDAARWAWSIPVDGPFWFASIPLAGIDGDTMTFALVLPTFALVIVLSYLGHVALSGLGRPGARAGIGLERWLGVSLALTAIGAAIARPRLPLDRGLQFGAGALLVAAGIAVLALLTRVGPPRAGRPRSTLGPIAPLVLVTAAGLAAVLWLPQLTATSFGPPPRCSCLGPHVEPLAHFSLHAFAFVALAAGVAALARSFVGPKRSARVPTIALVALLGGAEFLAESVRNSYDALSPVARVSPLYAVWSITRGRTEDLLVPSAVALTAGLTAIALAASIDAIRRRRSP